MKNTKPKKVKIIENDRMFDYQTDENGKVTNTKELEAVEILNVFEVPKDIMKRANRASKRTPKTVFWIVRRDDEFEIVTNLEDDDELYYTFTEGKYF